jgi:class 3 adenylate cyclase
MDKAPLGLPIWPLTVMCILVRRSDALSTVYVPELDQAWQQQAKQIVEILKKRGLEYIDVTDYVTVAITGKLIVDEATTESMVLAALEIRGRLAETNAGSADHRFEFKIGLHTDDVVAGIVSSAKMPYGLYSHTMHVAYRMARSANIGTMNISEYTHHYVQHIIRSEYWGALDSMGEIHRPSRHFFDKARRNIPHIRTGWVGMYQVDGTLKH